MVVGAGARPRYQQWLCLGVLLLSLNLAACGSSSHKSKPETDLVVHVPLVDAREVPFSPATAATDGNFRLTPLAVECGLTYLIGTHAEVDFKGQLCRFRIAVRNVDNTTHVFDTTAQRLIDTMGSAVTSDAEAMSVKRQADQPSLSAGDTVVLSIYFGLPAGRVPKTIVLHGDNDPSGIGTTVTAPHHAGGVKIAIPPRALYTPKPIF